MKTTKEQAYRKAWLHVKKSVKASFNWDNYNEDAIKKHGLKLLKKEIFHAKKMTFVYWDAISKEWIAAHVESGIIK